jgi:hypothetical protein
MIYKKLVFSGLWVFLALSGLNAQEALSAAGGEASGSGGSASFSAGQLFYRIHSGAEGSVAEGVQQPYEISVITSIEEIIAFATSVFPNPVTDYLILRTEMDDGMSISFKLFDASGRLLDDRRITDHETMIYMGRYFPGTYFLKITDGSRDLKTFKIIKH